MSDEETKKLLHLNRFILITMYASDVSPAHVTCSAPSQPGNLVTIVLKLVGRVLLCAVCPDKTGRKRMPVNTSSSFHPSYLLDDVVLNYFLLLTGEHGNTLGSTATQMRIGITNDGPPGSFFHL